MCWGFKLAHIYHTGSIAIGAFIIAVIQFIRIVFMFLAERAKQMSPNNKFLKIIICMGECCLKCIERICDYINSAAYAYIAVSGDSFFVGAWKGFLLNIKHIMQFGFANFLAKVFIMLGKVALTVGNCFSLLFIMKNITKDSSEVSSIWGPVFVVAVFSYITACLFFGIFETAVMALMTCLAVDMDLHDGKPKFGPPTFHSTCKKVEGRDKEIKGDSSDDEKKKANNVS